MLSSGMINSTGISLAEIAENGISSFELYGVTINLFINKAQIPNNQFINAEFIQLYLSTIARLCSIIGISELTIKFGSIEKEQDLTPPVNELGEVATAIHALVGVKAPNLMSHRNQTDYPQNIIPFSQAYSEITIDASRLYREVVAIIDNEGQATATYARMLDSLISQGIIKSGTEFQLQPFNHLRNLPNVKDMDRKEIKEATILILCLLMILTAIYEPIYEHFTATEKELHDLILSKIFEQVKLALVFNTYLFVNGYIDGLQRLRPSMFTIFSTQFDRILIMQFLSSLFPTVGYKEES